MLYLAQEGIFQERLPESGDEGREQKKHRQRVRVRGRKKTKGNVIPEGSENNSL